ncbi:MAG TPA: hypothetical protein ENF83_00515, partial [Candidatus Korarchaeota archaeon]|nr:hypothetical protein [Candidatus Korarchaeota archaeon]
SEAERFVGSTPSLGRSRGWQNWRACDIFELARDQEKREREERDPCVVCSLFGNTGLASHVRFFDSIPLGDYSLETITRVAIERATGGQSPGKLFRVQIVSPGTLWSFRMELINVDLRNESDPVSFLARYVLRRLFEGVQVGGGRSVGYGAVKLLREGLSIRVTSVREGELRTEELGPELLGELSGG